MADNYPPAPGSGRPDDEPDPLAALFGGSVPPELREQLQAMGLDKIDPSMLQMVQDQMQAMMSGPDTGPVNTGLAKETAGRVVSAAGEGQVSSDTSRDVSQVVQVAQLWLDQATEMPQPEGGARALSRTDWVEQTMPVWQQVTEPVAAGVSAAISRAMHDQLGQVGDIPEHALPPGMADMDPAALAAQMEPMVRRMSSAMFGSQLGQAVGALAGETVSGTEVGLPLLPGHAVTMLPANVALFADGLSIDAGEVHLYLAVREAARVRLYASVGWLGPQLLAAVQDYARDITIDTERIESAVRDADPMDPQSMQDALAGGMFSPEPSSAQRAALTRLETYLALVEGWVDLIADEATTAHLPHVSALAEAVRRRRASGGPAEKVFSGLVGLELRPRRLRDARNLWAAVHDKLGPEARDRCWDHPDLAPTAADLDDPLGYVERAEGGFSGGSEEMDAELDKLLRDSGN